jgi:hypothetical protein
VLVQAAADEGQKSRYIRHEGARLGYRMRRSRLVEVSDLNTIEGCIGCEETQRSSEARGLHFG